MKGYKALFGVSLLGLSLAGCGTRCVELKNLGDEPVKLEEPKTESVLEHVKSNEVRLSEDGYQVNGKIKGVNIRYTYFHKNRPNTVWLELELKNGKAYILISDGEADRQIDGNMNYFRLHNPHFVGKVYCEDNGDIMRKTGFTEEEVKRLRKWGNGKLKEVYELCKEKFGDELKIPYKAEKKTIEKKSLDEILKDFGF